MEDLVSRQIRVTRTSSVASELTRDDDSTDSIQQEETSILESQGRESMDTEWTDEKHSLYLKSMEASFVNQLYNSSALLGWRSQNDCSSNPKSSRQMRATARSGQFKVLQDGCWAKINFSRDEFQLSKADGSHVLSANPWIRHFRSGCRHHIVTSPAPQEKEKPALVTTTSNGFPVSHSGLCRQDSVGSNTEGTDQNFVDEDVEKEKAGRICSTKRMKTSVVATSSNDQVVPFGKFPIAEYVAVNCGSVEE